MDILKFEGKTVEEAITEATSRLGVTSTELKWDVIDKGSAGFLGIGKKNAVIEVRIGAEKEENAQPEQRAAKKPEKKAEPVKKQDRKPEKEKGKVPVPDQKKEEPEKAEQKESSINDEILQKAKEFAEQIFKAMKIETEVSVSADLENNTIEMDLSGDNMGILIGKRGQTLDALQYIISLYINKEAENYISFKLDTENYRARRKQTLENLAKNIAYKVKRNRRPIALEPMNPYERRIIHSALQNDKYVYTKSEGVEPFRKVVVLLKKS